MCDYPECKEESTVTQRVGDKTLSLCKEHIKLYQFMKIVEEFNMDWGF